MVLRGQGQCGQLLQRGGGAGQAGCCRSGVTHGGIVLLGFTVGVRRPNDAEGKGAELRLSGGVLLCKMVQGSKKHSATSARTGVSTSRELGRLAAGDDTEHHHGWYGSSRALGLVTCVRVETLVGRDGSPCPSAKH